MNMQRVGCLCPLFLTLSTALVVVWGEVWNEVQAVFLTLILGRLHHRGACRVLTQYTHTILRSVFGEPIVLCVWHRSVNYVVGAIGKRSNRMSMRLYAILRYCQTTEISDDVYHPPSTRCDLHRQIHQSTLFS